MFSNSPQVGTRVRCAPRCADCAGVPKSKGKRRKLGQLLVAAGAIDPAQLNEALDEQKRSGGLLGVALVRMGVVDERSLVRALAGQLNLPVIQLHGKQISREVLDLVPVELVEKHRCLPLLISGEGDARVLYLGMEDPSDSDVVAEICTLVGLNVQAVLVAPTELHEGIFRHYHFEGFGMKPVSELPSTVAPHPLRNSAPASQAIEPNAHDMGSSCLDDFGPEPSFVGLDELGSEHPGGSLECDDAPALTPIELTPEASDASASSEAMLIAIAQLLVEKGVFTRDELVDQLQAMSKPKGGA